MIHVSQRFPWEVLRSAFFAIWFVLCHSVPFTIQKATLQVLPSVRGSVWHSDNWYYWSPHRREFLWIQTQLKFSSAAIFVSSVTCLLRHMLHVRQVCFHCTFSHFAFIDESQWVCCDIFCSSRIFRVFTQVFFKCANFKMYIKTGGWKLTHLLHWDSFCLNYLNSYRCNCI